jgi:hypothetical protein
MKKWILLTMLVFPLSLHAGQESENPMASKFFEGYVKTAVGFANAVDYRARTARGVETDYEHRDISYTLSADSGLMFRIAGLFFAGAGFGYDYIYNNATSFQYQQTADFEHNQRMQIENRLHILNFSTMSLYAAIKYCLRADGSLGNLYLTGNIGYGTARDDAGYRYRGGIHISAGFGFNVFGDYNLEIGYAHRRGSVSWTQPAWNGTADENVDYSADYTYNKWTVAAVKTF